MYAFRPYSNIVIIEDQTPRNLTRYQERLLAEQDAIDRATMTLVVSRRQRSRSPPPVEEEAPCDPEGIEAPFARELFDFTFGPSESYVLDVENEYDDFDDYYEEHVDDEEDEEEQQPEDDDHDDFDAQDAWQDYYEYNIRYEGEVDNPYAMGRSLASY
jgi:hypothetical protein